MRFKLPMIGLLLGAGFFAFAGSAAAVSSPPSSAGAPFTFHLETADFEAGGITPEFGNVRNFLFELDLKGPLAAGSRYENGSIEEVRYLVRGSLNVDPPTPSGFPAFALNRQESGEGPISAEDWEMQKSRLAFKIAQGAQLHDGVQLSELVALGSDATILKLDALEWGRLDRARYHPPQLLLYADGTGILRNSKNSSGGTGTVNPGTGELVDVDYGEEYITHLSFDPSKITVIDHPVVPEPGTAILMALGLMGLASGRRSRAGSEAAAAWRESSEAGEMSRPHSGCGIYPDY